MGEELNSYYYDAFGNITEEKEKFDNPYRYAGYQYDKETKTYYLMCRMYNPSTASFMQEDSYRGKIEDPLSLNLYSYCENNPLIYDDPTGHWLHIAIGAAVEGAITGAIAAATGRMSLGAQALIMAGAGFIGNSANQYISKGRVDFKEASIAGLFTGITHGAIGKIFKSDNLFNNTINKAVTKLKNLPK
ncbi:RHS repeat-associated core domain-containing protein [Clostridium cavendishii]|nr:RHS repeat-associated core domain-containing protein [Clostridium cavendishii]